MSTTPPEFHPSDSREQRLAEEEIRQAVARELDVCFEGQPKIEQRVDLDGFADGEVPFCLEIWAHQGPAKGGQRHKVMSDFCKMLFVQERIGRTCRKVFAVCDERAIAFLKNSWQKCFADKFGIEVLVVQISDATREQVLLAQQRQFR